MPSFQSIAKGAVATVAVGEIGKVLTSKPAQQAKAAVSGLSNVPTAGNIGTQSSSDDIKVKSRDKNIAYQVVIRCTDLNISAKGYLPENFGIAVGSSYGAPFADMTGYSMLPGGKLMEAMPSLTGSTSIIQEQTVLIWQGSGGVEFSLALQLIAQESVLNEITQPFLDLAELCVPYQASDELIMRTPGPQWNAATAISDTINSLETAAANAVSDGLSYLTSGTNQPVGATQTPTTTLGNSIKQDFQKGFKHQISVIIGDYIYLPNVVVKNVDFQYEALMIAPSVKGGNDGGPGRGTLTVSFQTMFNVTIQDLYRMFQRDPTKTRTDLAKTKANTSR